MTLDNLGDLQSSQLPVHGGGGPAHWQAGKHVLHYLKGTIDHHIVYQPSDSPEPFITHSDADHGGNPDNGKSRGGYVVKIGSGAVSWSSKLQPLVALSTTEAEHISAVEAGKEILWMCQLHWHWKMSCVRPGQFQLQEGGHCCHLGRIRHVRHVLSWGQLFACP